MRAIVLCVSTLFVLAADAVQTYFVDLEKYMNSSTSGTVMGNRADTPIDYEKLERFVNRRIYNMERELQNVRVQYKHWQNYVDRLGNASAPDKHPADKLPHFRQRINLLTSTLAQYEQRRENVLKSMNSSEEFRTMDFVEKQIEILGVPETDCEKVRLIVRRVCQLITIADIGITRAFRRPTNDTPPSIVIQLDTKGLRRMWLRHTRDFNFTANMINSTFPKTPVFLSEYIPEHLVQLRSRILQSVYEKGYKFIWYQNGRLNVQKDAESDVIDIGSVADIERM